MIYEYKCNDCEHQFEVWAKVSDPAPAFCPSCKSSKLEKVIFAANFALKGGGWYAQGYGSSGGKQDSGSHAAMSQAGSTDAPKADTSKSASSATKNVKSDSASSGSSNNKV